MALRYAYNTNGCNNHRLYDALDLIAEAGYSGIALTLDWHHLDPFADNWEIQTQKLKRRLDELGLGSVIETGARFLLNPKQKHEPTLINPTQEGRAYRVRFLKRAVYIAKILESETVSFWAGVLSDDVSKEEGLSYLKEGITEVAKYASEQGVVISVEPEPGMLVETIADYHQLIKDIPYPIKLALDIGHVWVTGEMEPIEVIKEHAANAGTISIEGMQKGIHVHLPLNQGDMDVVGIVKKLEEMKYPNLVCVELSREGHRAHLAITESMQFLMEIASKQIEV
ncbi:sugar phosphate isomerase/epimerase [Aquimarina sp. ERC-38]|uniref:sugar phosphate isomerase/epimerase family protein n=1 Tax=Aquimarina sp. ERC-38 TaxID=2949996 RepID=UPI0022479FFA|nr:sugar phosphate isomerase/epimerase family protein [Aquimarina sp. ERC-38]UZO79265.1 sugar phosphate isomerase/epimerase [Aquimarina sp. ERC-38]